MRLRSISLRGVTRFTAAEPLGIPRPPPGPGLIALAGPNGAGKTTALEAAVAALYRAFPSRPGWYENFSGRDAFLEARFLGGGDEITVRTQVDAEKRTTEQYVFVNGQSVTTGRAKEAEAEVEKRFGSVALLLASVFASQGKQGNFLLATKGQRKELFAELLGLSRLQQLHEAAKGRQLVADGELAGARLVARNVEAELESLPALEERLAAARADVERVFEELESAKAAEASAAVELQAARIAWERVKDLRKTLEAAERELEAATKSVAEAQSYARRVDVDAGERRRLLEAQDPAAEERRARERHAVAHAALRDRRRNLEALVAREPEVLAAAAKVTELESELAELERAEASLRELQAEEKVAVGAAIGAERALRDARDAREVERKRLVRQSTLLGAVPCTEYERWSAEPPDTAQLQPVALSAGCPLLSDARAARQALDELAASPEPDQTELERARGRLEEIRGQIRDASVACDPIRVQDLQRELPKLRRTAADVAVERAKADLAGLNAESSRIDEVFALELADAEEQRKRLAAALSELEEGRLRDRAAAEERIEDTLHRVASAEDRREMAQRAYVAATEAIADRDDVERNHRQAIARRNAAEMQLRGADQVAAGLAAQVEHRARKREDLVRLCDDAARAEVEVGDWSLLARALGKDGVQALEIDAAGPEVARLTNELLEACYGSRFSISFETLREKKSARGEYSEAFDVKVYDQGHERTVEALSGGERVVVGEAVGLALAIFNSRKSGIRHETFFRDETAGALDPEHAAQYVLMLRRARQLAGAHQILFVSHQREVWESADTQIFVDGGRLSLGQGLSVRLEEANATSA